MIQVGSLLNVVDNSGAKKACCIKILEGSSKKKYGEIGDLILVVVKTLRLNKAKVKVKKGEIIKGLIVRSKFFKNDIRFQENSVVLLNKQFKTIGTRVFGPVLKSFRFTKFLRIALISSELL